MVVLVNQTLDHVHRVLGVGIQLLCSKYRTLFREALEEDDRFNMIFLVNHNERAINENHAWLANIVVFREDVFWELDLYHLVLSLHVEESDLEYTWKSNDKVISTHLVIIAEVSRDLESSCLAQSGTLAATFN